MNFDDFAKNWDTEERINRAKIISKEIINSIDVNRNYVAMEFGCGTGLISFNIFKKFKSITLIDSSKGMIDILNSKINKYKIKNMFTYNVDISTKSTLNTKFDVIYNSMVLHHINDTRAIVKNFHDLLNEKGYLCIVDLDEEDGSFHKNYPDYNGHNGFNQEYLINILKNTGFKDIECNTFFYGEKKIEGEIIPYSLFLLKARKY